MKKNIILGGIVMVLTILMIVSAVWCFGVAIPLYNQAEESGAKSGELLGNQVGMGIGAFNGLTDGVAQGLKDGKEEGLSAKDTTVGEIERSFSEVGTLEVLSASVNIRNLHEAGGGDYKSLEILFGKGVFTVDLSEADITEFADGTLEIKVPDPQMEMYIDEDKTEHLAEYQKFPWSGNAQDGYDAYINSRIIVDEKIQDKVAHYDWLLAQAKESAEKQVRMLAESVILNGKQVTVSFTGKVGVS